MVSLVPFFIKVRLEETSLIPYEISSLSKSNNFISLESFSSFLSTVDFFCKLIIFFFSSALADLLLFSKSFVPITTPLIPGSALFDASLTSPAFSPKNCS